MSDVVITSRKSEGRWLPPALSELEKLDLHIPLLEYKEHCAAFRTEYEGEIAEPDVADLLFVDWLGRRLGIDLVERYEKVQESAEF